MFFKSNAGRQLISRKHTAYSSSATMPGLHVHTVTTRSLHCRSLHLSPLTAHVVPHITCGATGLAFSISRSARHQTKPTSTLPLLIRPQQAATDVAATAAAAAAAAAAGTLVRSNDNEPICLATSWHSGPTRRRSAQPLDKQGTEA